jgi:hypothetical protein
MSHKAKGPAVTNRWVFHLKLIFPILSHLHPQTKCFLRQIAKICPESVTSQGPSVLGLSLPISWRHLEQILHKGAE